MLGNLMSTIAGQKLLADVASIAQSLRVIAKAVKEQKENKEKQDEHR